MSAAPIALFTYNRPWHTRRTVEALKANHGASESDLFLFSDGPRRPEDAEKVAELRAYLRGIDGFRSVTITERETNLGLSKSIIKGVTDTVARHGRVIVLEDDMVTSPHFLRYMNEGLELYRDDEAVFSLTAYIYPVTDPLPPAFFLRGADCWGWATWKRAWEHFEPDGRKLLAELERRGLTRAFDIDGSFPYTKMLRGQIEGRNDSWAVRWYATAFLLGKVTLYPGIPLLQNIGNDGEGTHARKTDKFEVKVAESPLKLARIPAVHDAEAAKAVARYFRRTRISPGALVRRLIEAIRG